MLFFWRTNVEDVDATFFPSCYLEVNSYKGCEGANNGATLEQPTLETFQMGSSISKASDIPLQYQVDSSRIVLGLLVALSSLIQFPLYIRTVLRFGISVTRIWTNERLFLSELSIYSVHGPLSHSSIMHLSF
jgi:hypothetical protein